MNFKICFFAITAIMTTLLPLSSKAQSFDDGSGKNYAVLEGHPVKITFRLPNEVNFTINEDNLDITDLELNDRMTLSYHYRTVDGTAKAGKDYEEASGMLHLISHKNHRFDKGHGNAQNHVFSIQTINL